MQLLFSVLALVGIVGFAVWWSARDMDLLLPTQEPIQETVTPPTINPGTTPVEQAQTAKELMESHTLISLDLSERGLTKVPVYVFDRTDLESLDLSNNNLDGSLPAEVRKLSNLKVLDLSGNKFTGLPAEVGQLSQLEKLNLANNLLTGLPHELGNLQNLQELNLSGNHYSPQDLDTIKKKLPQSTIIKTE